MFPAIMRFHRYPRYCVPLGMAFMILQFAGQVLAADAVARIVSLKGVVDIRSVGASGWAPAMLNQFLFAGDAIRTGVDAKVAILLADETQIQINRDTLLELKEVAQASGWQRLQGLIKASITTALSHYRLDRGEIWVRNNNRDLHINIETTFVSAAIRGTELTVRMVPDERATITVLEGRIEAANPLGSLIATTGEEVTATPGAAPRKRLLVQPEDAVQWTLTVPRLFGARNFPLISADQEVLLREYAGLSSSSAVASPGSQVRLGQVLRDLGRAEEAWEVFQRVLDAGPVNPEVRTGLGWVLVDQEQWALAFSEFNRVAAPGPLNTLGRIVALAEQNRLVEAQTLLKEAQQRYPDDWIFALADAYLALLGGRIRDSQDALQKLLALAPDQALAWDLLALVSVMLNEKDAALAAADQAVALTPGSPTAHLIRSYTLQARFDLGAAMQSVRRALAIDPQQVQALVDLARLEFGSDYLNKAWTTIEQAHALAPNDTEVLSLRGFIQLAKGELVAAEADFRLAMELEPGLSEPWLGRSLIHMRRGEVAIAMEEIVTAVLLDPQRSLWLSYWAKMLFQIQRFDKALEVLDRAQALDPRDPTAALYRAIILRDLNRPGEAIKALNQAITLNDNRGVYRSRYLLDQDLAVKNVDLSLLYNQLGLNTWAERKAIQSIKQDYTNHAGHLFYAGALMEQEGRDYPFVAEALLGRLLQPANANTFNSFNSYTSVFEEPDLDINIAASLGTQKTRGGELLIDGVIPSGNLAWQGGVIFERTDGWRGTNFDLLRSFAGIAKWQPTLQDGVMLAASQTRTREGDEDFPRFEYDSPADPVERSNADVTRLEFGYHHHFSPRSDLLIYLAHLDMDLFLKDHSRSELLPDFSIDEDLLEGVDYNNRFNQTQIQYLHQFSRHQLIAGGAFYWGDKGVHYTSTLNVLLNNAPVQIPPAPQFVVINGTTIFFPAPLPYIETRQNSPGVGYRSFYLQDIWQWSTTITLEAALYYDRMENAAPVPGTTWRQQELNPRIGLIWSPTPTDTVRLAAFRYLVPFISTRIDPTDIAGIPIIRNTEEGAENTEYAMAFEHEWISGMASANLYSLRRSITGQSGINGPGQMSQRKGRMEGAELKLNQLLGNSLGLSAVYHHAAIQDELLPEADRSEDRVSVGLSLARSNGLSGKIRQTWRYLDPDGERASESMLITDLDLGYEFPGKRGSVKLEVRNLFNEHFNWVVDRFILQGRAPTREILATLAMNF